MLLRQRLAQYIVCIAEEGVQRNCLPALRYRLFETMCDDELFRQIGANDEGERIQTYRRLHFGDGLVISSKLGQMPAVPVVTGRIVRAKLNSSLVLPTARLPIPVEAI